VIEITRLTRQIREALSSDPGHAPVESLAATYARFCQEAALRLDSCAAMLERGSEYQALQLAETEPILLDLIAGLSFEHSEQWFQFCVHNELSIPKKFDSRAIQALDQLYSKGISSNHPLYRDYRAAVLSRDDTKAIQIMRSIARMNPSDANAKSELARLENKLFQVKLIELRKTLAAKEEELCVAHLAEIERLATPDRLTDLPEYLQACALRRDVLRREAITTAERLSDALEDEHQAGAWRMVGDLVARIRALQSEHAFQLSESLEKRCAEMQHYFGMRRAEFQQASQYQGAIAALRGFVERVDSRLLARSTLSGKEAEELQVEFHKLWTVLESFKRPHPEDFEVRVHSCANSLRAELNRMRFQRRLKIAAISAVAILLVGLVSWVTVTEIRAGEFAAQLVRLQAEGQVTASQKMLSELPVEHPDLVTKPKLRGRMQETEHWIEVEREKMRGVEAGLEDLERSLRGSLSVNGLSSAKTQLDSATQLLEKLASDQQAGVGARLLVVRNLFEEKLAAVREQVVARTDVDLSELEALAASSLLYDQPRSSVKKALGEIEPRLKQLGANLNPSLIGIQIPPAHRIRAEELRKRFDLFTAENHRLESVTEALLKATTFDSYLEALRGFQASSLRQEPEVVLARRLLENIPQLDTLLAALLMPDDPVGWAAIKTNTNAAGFLPKDVMQPELDRLISMRSDKLLNNVWELEFSDFKRQNKTFPVYNLGGELEESKSSAGTTQSVIWKGNLYYPGPTTEAPNFKVQSITMKVSTAGKEGDGEVLSKKLSSTSNCMRFLELHRMTEETGTKYEKSLIQVLDVLVQNQSSNLVFRAYMFQQIVDLIRMRPYVWGWHYAESIRADTEALEGICGHRSLRSGDWMVDVKNTQLGPKLAPFFAGLQSRQYLREAGLRREMIHRVITAGLKFGGYLDGAGTPRLLGEAQGGKELWVLLADGRKLRRYSPNAAVADSATSTQNRDKSAQAPFSPIFFVPLDRQELLASLDRQFPGVMGNPLKPPLIPWCMPPQKTE
jgi:hypothetical protein